MTEAQARRSDSANSGREVGTDGERRKVTEYWSNGVSVSAKEDGRWKIGVRERSRGQRNKISLLCRNLL